MFFGFYWRSMLKPHAATEPIGSFFDNPAAGPYSLRVEDRSTQLDPCALFGGLTPTVASLN
jgi:hypothetical protein